MFVPRKDALPGARHPVEPTSASPVRVQLKRAKGWRMPPNTVKVDRSTTWGNHDFIVGEDGDAEHCVEMFHHDLDKFQVFHPADYEAWIAPLRGKNLACWCRPGSPCHADVLLELANDPQTTGAEPALASALKGEPQPKDTK